MREGDPCGAGPIEWFPSTLATTGVLWLRGHFRMGLVPGESAALQPRLPKHTCVASRMPISRH